MTPADLTNLRDMFRNASPLASAATQPTTQPEVEEQQESTESASNAPITITGAIALALTEQTQGQVAHSIKQAVEGNQAVADALFVVLTTIVTDQAKDLVKDIIAPSTPAAHRAPKIPRTSKPSGKRSYSRSKKVGAGTPIEVNGQWARTGRNPSYSGGTGTEYSTTVNKKDSAVAAALFTQVVNAHGENVADFDSITLTFVDWGNKLPAVVNGTVKGSSDGFKWADTKKRNLKVGIRPAKGGVKVS